MAYETNFTRTQLSRALADRDDRQLLDIGLIRAADGSLRLAGDPARFAVPEGRKAGILARIGHAFRHLSPQSDAAGSRRPLTRNAAVSMAE